jgi:hypothetical protein
LPNETGSTSAAWKGSPSSGSARASATRPVAITQDGDRSAHERYLRLFRLLRERDAALARAFDDPRRSTGLRRRSVMVGLGVLTGEELAGIAPDVRDAARALGQPLAPRRTAPREDPTVAMRAE